MQNKHQATIKQNAEKLKPVQIKSARAIERLLNNMTRQAMGAKLK